MAEMVSNNIGSGLIKAERYAAKRAEVTRSEAEIRRKEFESELRRAYVEGYNEAREEVLALFATAGEQAGSSVAVKESAQ